MDIRDDEYYMNRAISLARNGYGHVSPNPAVGCVIVSSAGEIIGEGWHRQYGEGHAEVNAVASVSDEEQLCGASVYVTLEPCSHYGKTPPCASMLASLPVKRVVAGMSDPNPKVSGRGLAMLRDAGKEVMVGVLESKCRSLNAPFLTAQEVKRPYITLKWACDAHGMMGSTQGKRIIISNKQSEMWMHRERTRHDAIMVGLRTALLDNPSLNSRLWPGADPMPIVCGGDGKPQPHLKLSENKNSIWLPHQSDLHETVRYLLSEHGVTSLLVEGGARLLTAFIQEGLYDSIRIETTRRVMEGDIKAPSLPTDVILTKSVEIDGNRIQKWVNKRSVISK